MESKALESAEAPDVSARVGAAREGAAGQGAPQEPDSCCVWQTTVREGRVVTECVATCCDAAPAAREEVPARAAS